MRICVKDLSGSGSEHDPLSVSYVVIGGLYYVLLIILFWIKLNPIITDFVTIRSTERQLLILSSLVQAEIKGIISEGLLLICLISNDEKVASSK